MRTVTRCSVTANIPVLGTGDSGFESRHLDIYKNLSQEAFLNAEVSSVPAYTTPGIRKAFRYPTLSRIEKVYCPCNGRNSRHLKLL